MSESSTIANDDGEPPPRLKRQQQKQRRTRTGCERCRAHHRKCGEEKPRCKRCTRADTMCKYITHVSFLTKNFRTLSNDVLSKPSEASIAQGYPTLKFVVDNDSSTQEKYLGFSFPLVDIRDTGQPRNQRIDADIVPTLQLSSLIGNSRREGPEKGSHLVHQRDSQVLALNELRFKGACNDQRPSPNPSQSLANLEVAQSWPLVGQSSLSEDEVGLLKCYSYRVAPWLDVYDPDQTFRHSVSRMAMASPCVLEGILEVSAAFSSHQFKVEKPRGLGAFHLQAMSNPPGTDSPFLALRMIACFVLSRTRLFVQAVPETWEPSFHGGGAFLYFQRFKFADTSQRRMWFGFLTLILRLEIACYLMSQTAPVLIPELIHHILSSPKTYETSADQSRRILDSSLDCLRLLVDVMNITFPMLEAKDDMAPPRPADSTLASESRVDKWKKIREKLRVWYTNRPVELQQLVDVEGPETTFPTVIFTTGAGTSSNLLYHTAMFLLLSNRPQSVSLDEPQTKSPLDVGQMSPVWHERRVCGIALNSEPEQTNCWDPCMIAAFSLAAQRIIQSAQQSDIIACLGCVKAAGWRIDGLVQKLCEEWGLIG
ncbi:hypothetical protein F5Y19DRAFT_459102 [Xylariaceae sp. FL1651]|nr:hypothetical protein F5Y19DRAFT_459102 [Xylariaceae sp. FL1651]